MQTHKEKVAGIPWFRADEYERFVEIIGERRILPRAFGEWETSAQAELDSLKAQGTAPIKTYVHTETFLGWCQANGRDADSDALRDYAESVAHAVARN